MLSKFIKCFLAGTAGLLLPFAGQAFSLNGPFAAWQRQEIGYQIGVDSGGPMNLGEEYRWNQRSITYAFDNSFLDYFGTEGVAAVEEAIEMLNSLPAVSDLSADLSEFPLDTRRVNFTASALGLIDVKSFTLSALLEQLGLAAAERWVWTIRERVVINNVPFYSIIKRNFDPVTLAPSSYVNGTLYSYTILQTYANPVIYEAVESAVDPLASAVNSVAALVGVGGGTPDLVGFNQTSSSGLFYSGLTRDDVGGLRYLYNPRNYNMETLSTGAEIGTGGTGDSAGSPFGGGGGGGDPWAPVIGGGITTGAGATAGIGTDPNALGTGNQGQTFTNFVRPLINQGLRGGVDKFVFTRVNYDSILGTVLSYTNRYSDRYITNGQSVTQPVQIVSTQPDIVFTAADLGVIQEVPVTYSRGVNFVNQDAINGVEALSGPGNISGGSVISFSSVGPWWDQSLEGSREEDGLQGFLWGRFDGSTNTPTVFPSGISIRELESKVLGRR